MTTFALKDIQPNPFRRMDRYPLRRDKIEVLRESLRTTGYWDNVVGRIGKGGKPEISYGHHRLAAMLEEFSPSTKVELIIRDLDDTAMLQIMARENGEVWGSWASVENETARAAVEAYAEGLIQLSAPGPDTNKSLLRYAPSFTPGGYARRASGERTPPGYVDRPYTAQTLAEFLGWLKPGGRPKDRVLSILIALQLIEEGMFKESDFDGLTPSQAEGVVIEARKTKAAYEAAARAQKQAANQALVDKAAAEQRKKQAKNEAEREKAQELIDMAERRKEEALEKEAAQLEQGGEEAQNVGRQLGAKVRSEKLSTRGMSQAAAEIRGKKPGPPPHIERFAKTLANDLSKLLAFESSRRNKLQQLINYREHLFESSRVNLALCLEQVSEEALSMAAQFREPLVSDSRVVANGHVGRVKALPKVKRR